MDNERLYNDLTQYYSANRNIRVMKLAKSGGVRSQLQCASLDLLPGRLSLVPRLFGGGPALARSRSISMDQVEVRSIDSHVYFFLFFPLFPVELS